jgi:hypothetical protein
MCENMVNDSCAYVGKPAKDADRSSLVWQDTPVLNTPEDVEVVVDYVRAQLHAYVSTEEDPERCQPMSRLADPRVDVALYFIAPHALKPQDIDAMARLSLLVPIVPLLAKVCVPQERGSQDKMRLCGKYVPSGD